MVKKSRLTSAFLAAIRESPVPYPGSTISACGVVTASRRQQEGRQGKKEGAQYKEFMTNNTDKPKARKEKKNPFTSSILL